MDDIKISIATMERCKNIHPRSQKNVKLAGKSMKNANRQITLPSARQLSRMTSKGKDLFNFMFFEFDKKGHKKKVNASEATLSTYHESFLYGKVPLTIQVRAALRTGRIGYMLALVEFILSLLSVVLYIRSTYTIDNGLPTRIMEIVSSMFFVVDYALKVYSAPFRVLYIFSWSGLVDLLSALPVIYVFNSSVREQGSAIQMLRFLRILRLFHLIRRLGVIGSTIGQQIFVLVMYTLGIVFVMAGFFQYVERSSDQCTVGETQKKNDTVGDNDTENGCIDFYGAFYFMIVTILTVGNGPTSPTSEMGRFVVLITILLALTILPVQITKISNLASRRPYGGTYSAKSVLGARFVILTGSINIDVVRNYLAEFYSPIPEEELAAFPLRVIVMAPFKPSFELKNMLSLYGGLVRFIEGSPLKHSDLSRVSAKAATAVYILADKFSQDYAVEDAGQMAGALSVHQYCGADARIITELLNPENLQSDIWEGLPGNIETICPQQLRFQLLARSCYVKGLSTLVSNLFVSAVAFHPPDPESWEQEYRYGLEHELYPVLLPEVFHSRTFKEVCEFIFVEFSVLLLGLDITASPESPEVPKLESILLFPKDHLIQKDDVGIVIAESLSAVQAISAFGTTPATSMSFLQSSGMVAEQLWENAHDTWDDISYYSDNDQSEIRSALSIASSRQRSRVVKIDETGPDHASEEMTERILTWPPKILTGKPRLPVIAMHEDDIRANLRQKTVSSVKFQRHILVCCECRWPRNLYYFVEHLRLPGFPTPPIVILSPHEPQPEEWGCLGIFEDVFYVKGTGTSRLDLLRAGLASVQHVLVFTEDLSEARGYSSEDDDTSASNNMYANDLTNTIVVTVVERIRKSLKKKGCVTAELRYNPTFRYVKPLTTIDPLTEKKMSSKKNRDGLYMFLPCYAEGKAFAPDMLDYVLASSFTNKNTVSLMEAFIIGKPVPESRSNIVLDMIDVPSDYGDLTYLELFRRLLTERNMMAVGLYRHTSHKNSQTPYVFTNPWHDAIVNPDDGVYVFWTKNAVKKSYMV